MEKKQDKEIPAGVAIIAALGIMLSVFIFKVPCVPVVYLMPAFIILLSVGLLKLWNWARVTLIILSLILTLLVVYSIVFVGAQGLALFVEVPILLFSILVIIYLTRFKIKERFK